MNLTKDQKNEIMKLHQVILSEILGVAFGNRPSILRSLDQPTVKILKRTFPFLEFISGGQTLNPMSNLNSLELYGISKNKEIAKDLIIAQRERDHYEIGKLLGYPECCIKKWMNRKYRPWSKEAIAESCDISKDYYFQNNNIYNFSSRLGPRREHLKMQKECIKMNQRLKINLTQIQFISHVPCSYDCKGSLAIGHQTYDLLLDFSPWLAKRLKQVLIRPMLVFDLFSWVAFDGIGKDNCLDYKKIVYPRSLVDEKIIKKISQGCRLEVGDEEIKIYKNNKTIQEIKKQDKNDGILLNFHD